MSLPPHRLASRIQVLFCFAHLCFVSSCRPHCLADKSSPPTRGDLLKTTSTGEGWRLGFLVKGDTPKTISS